MRIADVNYVKKNMTVFTDINVFYLTLGPPQFWKQFYIQDQTCIFLRDMYLPLKVHKV